jgi:hypothetical protein
MSAGLPMEKLPRVKSAPESCLPPQGSAGRATFWNIDVFLQNSLRLMWIYTCEELVNFDGFNFKLISTAYTMQWPEKIQSLTEDMHNNVWLMRSKQPYCSIVNVLHYTIEEVLPLHVYLSL